MARSSLGALAVVTTAHTLCTDADVECGRRCQQNCNTFQFYARAR
ncbi:Uncharacterised protein [Mycobacterium tuberculosis]|nr:Uncharacterised protein [Mycobacterium tuberculosis]